MTRRRSGQRSDEAQAWASWYWTKRWRSLRAAYLRENPYCAMCQGEGRVRAATVLDHVTPHKGDPDIFWNGPFQGLCKEHHDSEKRIEEARGYGRAVDEWGFPIDPRHPFNRVRGEVK